MPKDYEPIIRARNPQVSWKDCSYAACKLRDFFAEKGSVVVPYNYDRHEEKTFSVSFQRFRHPNSVHKPIEKIILILPGGPGSAGRSKDDTVISILKAFPNEAIACITVDHRGLGDSAPFLPPNLNLNDVAEVNKYAPSLPFPMRDLTTHNAALDVVSITIALLNEPEGNAKKVKSYVSGTSYGAGWTNITVRLAPNLFEAAYMGMPAILEGQKSNGSGPAATCALDDFCRQKLGGNVVEEYHRGIRRIVDYDTNECTLAFGNLLNSFSGLSKRDRLLYLIVTLHKLMVDRLPQNLLNRVSGPQLLVFFVRLTSDCVDPDAYLKSVLPSFAPLFAHTSKNKQADFDKLSTVAMKTTIPSVERDEFIRTMVEKYTAELGPSEYNFDLGRSNRDSTWVNRLGFINLYCKNGLPDNIPAEFNGISQDVIWPASYYEAYRALLPHLQGKIWTENLPLQSKKTRVIISHGMMDLRCTYEAAYQTAMAIKAPEVHWILSSNIGHLTRRKKCWVVAMRIFLGLPAKDLQKCLAQEEAIYKLDWTFKKVPQFEHLWKYVRSSGQALAVREQVKDIPYYRVFKNGNMSIPSQEGITAKGNQFGFYFWITVTFGFLCFIGIVGWFIWVWYRRRKLISSDDSLS